MSAIRVGTILTHKAWGVGKVLFLTETKAVVGFAACRTPTDPGLRDVSLRGTFIEPTSSEPDPAPDNWNITLDANGRAASPRARSTRAAALKTMAARAASGRGWAIARSRTMPGEASKTGGPSLERAWKWEKQVEWHERSGQEALPRWPQTNTGRSRATRGGRPDPAEVAARQGRADSLHRRPGRRRAIARLFRRGGAHALQR